MGEGEGAAASPPFCVKARLQSSSRSTTLRAEEEAMMPRRGLLVASPSDL